MKKCILTPKRVGSKRGRGNKGHLEKRVNFQIQGFPESKRDEFREWAESNNVSMALLLNEILKKKDRIQKIVGKGIEIEKLRRRGLYHGSVEEALEEEKLSDKERREKRKIARKIRKESK